MTGTMKASTAITWVVLIAGGVFHAHGSHFRGGTINWKPTGVGNQVEVTYKLSFNGFKEPGEYPPSGHDICTQAKKSSGQVLLTTGWLECTGCGSGDSYRDMEWQCSDLDEVANWDIGAYSFNLTVPDVENKVLLFFERCCWVAPLKNAPIDHMNQGWKMMTEIDLTERIDNGLMNSSPITSAIPVQKFHAGCNYHLEIPVTDPDDDPYRCRYATSDQNECYETYSKSKFGDICSKRPFITVYENCTLKFDTSGGEGYYAVRVMIEDLDQNGDPMSRVSLSFLLQVDPDDTTCKTPAIKQPLQACKTIPVGQVYQETIVVEAASIDLPIERIETNKPAGMTVSELNDLTRNPLQKYVVVNWVPTRDQMGKQSLGFNAVDTSGFVSGWSFIVLKVADGKILNAVPVESTPSPGAVITATTEWEIKFNTEIQRPSSYAYIGLLDRTGNIVAAVDASNEQQVRFSGDKLSFFMSPPNLDYGTQSYRLVIEGGVAIHAEDDNCDMFSLPVAWDILIKGPENPPTAAPPAAQGPPAPKEDESPASIGNPSSGVPPTFKCTPGSISIPSPDGANEGDICFIHLEAAHATVTEEGIDVSYKLCCQSECPIAPPTVQPELTSKTQSPLAGGSGVAAGAFTESPEEPTEEAPIGPEGPVGTEVPTPTAEAMGPVGATGQPGPPGTPGCD